MNVLFVEVDHEVAPSLRRHLEQTETGIFFESVSTIDAVRPTLETNTFDVVVACGNSEDGITVLQTVKAFDQDLPVVLVLENPDANVKVRATQMGALDVLDSENVSVQELARLLLAKLQSTANAVGHSGSSDLINAIEPTDEAVLLIEDFTFVDCNAKAASMLGYDDPNVVRGRSPAELSPPTQPDGRPSAEKASEMLHVASQGGYHRFQWVHRRANGEPLPVIVSLTPIIHEGKQMQYCVWRELPEQPTYDSQEGTAQFSSSDSNQILSNDEATRVLVVQAHDGNEHDLSTEINGVDNDEIAVLRASSPNEAIMTLDSRDDIDCLLVNSGPGEQDSLDLLEQVNQLYPSLRTVLVHPTGVSDAQIQAEGAGITDHVVREPEDDVGPTLVDTIRSTVEDIHSEREQESTLQSYRMLTDALPDPTAFIASQEVEFANDAFEELMGRTTEQLRGQTFVESVVHPGDRNRFREVITGWVAGQADQSRHVVRFGRPDDTVRHCEVSGTDVTITSTAGALISVRDVTERTQKRRETQLERALYGTIMNHIADSRTRETFEETVLETLSGEGYDLAWIGEIEGESVIPRAIQGDSEFVETLDSAISEKGVEPFVRAGHTDQSQFVRDIETLLRTEWRDAAIERGYRSGFAVPLSYQNVSYGILAVYISKPDRFDVRERRMLERFADVVAFGIHSLELKNTRAVGSSTEATVVVEDDAYYLVDLAREGAFADCENIRVAGSVPKGESDVIQYIDVSCGTVSPVEDRLASHSAVTDVAVISRGDPIRVRVTVNGPVPESVLAARGEVISETSIEGGEALIRLNVPQSDDLQSVTTSLESSYGNVSIRPSLSRNPGNHTWTVDMITHSNLTEKQLAALKAAYYNGYFEKPRKSTASDIAESLDISHSTFLQHLHRAQEKLFGDHFE